MLCPSCGNKIQFIAGSFICETCDAEYDIFDMEDYLVPKPIFVKIRLQSQYAIIDTRKQEVYVRVDTMQKAKLITELLNLHFSETMLKKQLSSYFNFD